MKPFCLKTFKRQTNTDINAEKSYWSKLVLFFDCSSKSQAIVEKCPAYDIYGTDTFIKVFIENKCFAKRVYVLIDMFC